MDMNNPSSLLTFEWNSENEVLEIHGNRQGLEKLKDTLDLLLKMPSNDHYHMMTANWGGNDLSNEKQYEQNNLINHVKICIENAS